MSEETICELDPDKFSTCPRCKGCVELVNFKNSIQRLCTNLECDYWHIELKKGREPGALGTEIMEI